MYFLKVLHVIASLTCLTFNTKLAICNWCGTYKNMFKLKKNSKSLYIRYTCTVPQSYGLNPVALNQHHLLGTPHRFQGMYLSIMTQLRRVNG